MREDEEARDPERKRKGQPYHVRLPGFVAEGEIGLGDLVGKAAAYAGFRPCGGCLRRAAVLNEWFMFSGRRPR
jgi:hypothetical protein